MMNLSEPKFHDLIHSKFDHFIKISINQLRLSTGIALSTLIYAIIEFVIGKIMTK